jgi:CubicO group peptidase (beta-lactamase class C family)
MSESWAEDGARRLREVMADHVASGDADGLVWWASQGGEVLRGEAGALDDGRPVGPDTIFRVSSMTKPVTAVAALSMLDDGRADLDDPIGRWLPELADLQVLADPHGPVDRTVPAARPVTVRDLLTFRLGWGMDFSDWVPAPLDEAMASLELGAGPPQPDLPPPPDEWIRRLATMPLRHQPGTRWLYHTSAEVLGVWVARVAGRPFDEVLAERVLTPLAMHDTGFFVPPSKLDRFASCWSRDPASGERTRFDPPDGQWSHPPAFPSGGAGLVSTVDDFAAFARMLADGGVTSTGTRLLSAALVDELTTDQLTDEQRTAGGPDPTGEQGWGFGVGVLTATDPLGRPGGTYGWDGGLGSTWANVPDMGVIGILLTDRLWDSPALPVVAQGFWRATMGAVAES